MLIGVELDAPIAGGVDDVVLDQDAVGAGVVAVDPAGDAVGGAGRAGAVDVVAGDGDLAAALELDVVGVVDVAVTQVGEEVVFDQVA